MLTVDNLDALVARTQDAARARYYGRQEWSAIIQWLTAKDWSEQEIEAILRSKYMRWAEDHSGLASLRGFISFYEISMECTDYFARKTVDGLVDETFPTSCAIERMARLETRRQRSNSSMGWQRLPRTGF